MHSSGERILPPVQTALFLDSGRGFHAEELVHEQLECAPRFRITFALNPTVEYRQMRWDPLELRICTVRLRRVAWRDPAGVSHAVDLKQITANGTCAADGFYHFETVDPMFFLPIRGFVKSVTLEGDCLVASEAESLRRMEYLLNRRSEDLLWVKCILEEREEHYRKQQLANQQKDKADSLMKWMRTAFASFPRRSAG